MPKQNADLAMDAAACIGCGACVAACPNASAMLFVAAKVSHLALLPQGQPERYRRAWAMVDQMDAEGFGNCTNHGECEAACPKGITLDNIARLNRDYFRELRSVLLHRRMTAATLALLLALSSTATRCAIAGRRPRNHGSRRRALAVYGKDADVVVAGKGDGGVSVPLVASAVARVASSRSDMTGISIGSAGEVGWRQARRQRVRWAGGRQGAKAGLIALPRTASHLKKRAFPPAMPPSMTISHATTCWLSSRPISLPRKTRACAFVENGGGLLVAVTGWGWQQGSNRPMHELAGNQLLAGTGIAWTNGFAEKTIPDGYCAGGDVSTLLNAHVALERLGAAKLPRKDVAQATSSLLLALRTLPPDETEFHGRVRQLLCAGCVADRADARHPVRADETLRRLAVAIASQLAPTAPVDESALPAASDFPVVPADAPRVTRTIAIDTSVPDWHSLGVYAAPGEKITLMIPASAVPLKLSIRIGAAYRRTLAFGPMGALAGIIARLPAFHGQDT